MVHTLVWQQGFEGLRLGMGAGPHEVEVIVVDADFMEAMSVEKLTDYLGICLDHLEGQVVAGTCGIT